MLPLNLTETHPRSPKEELRGICMLPRMIDIARSKLPGGESGEYQIGRGLSALVLGRLGMSATQFIQLTAESADDADLARRVLSRISPIEAAELNSVLARLTVADAPADLQREFESFYGLDLPSERLIFDVLEEDDVRTSAASV